MPLNKITNAQSPTFSLTGGVLTAGLATFVLMYLFELSKQAFILTITIWKSHFLTIVFTTIVSSCSSYVVGRRLRSLNERLEERISDRTAELERVNQELEVDRQQIALLSRMSELLQTWAIIYLTNHGISPIVGSRERRRGPAKNTSASDSIL
jgi:C4-dicarboxylate-specific signal transduction histidine kinase